MSVNVGAIDLDLVLNSSKFQSQLGSVNKQANSASNTLTTTLGKIGKAVAVSFSVTAVVAFGKECLKVATETSNAWIRIKFNTNWTRKKF